MIKNIFISIAVALLANAACASTTLSGVVLDRHSGQTIPYACVSIKTLDKVVWADENGQYAIKLPQGERLYVQVAASAFKTNNAVLILSDAEQVMDFVLEMLPSGAKAKPTKRFQTTTTAIWCFASEIRPNSCCSSVVVKRKTEAATAESLPKDEPDQAKADKIELSVFPNPVINRNATVSVTLPRDKSAFSIALYTSAGQVVYSKKYSSTSRKTSSQELPTRLLPAGVYLVVVSQGDYRTTTNLVVQR